MHNTDTSAAANTTSWLQRARHKPLAFSLVYACLIIYASLYATKPWQDRGLDVFYFLAGPWPYYWTWEDTCFNILAYMPLGFLLTLSPTHRPWPWARILLPLLFGLLLSASLEALQTLIPGRVSSSMDLVLNGSGTLLGSAIALFCGPSLLQRAGDIRQKLGVRRLSAEGGFVILCLWLFAQISPETVFFGLGDLRGLLTLPTSLPFSPEIYSYLETVVAATQTLVMLFLVQSVLRRLDLRWVTIFSTALCILCLGIAIRIAASWLLIGQTGSTETEVWAALTPGGSQGLALGLALALFARFLPIQWQPPMAAMLLMASTVLVNLMPINPYSISALAVWRQGHFLTFNGLTRVIAALWPYLTLIFLVWTDRHRR